MGVKRRRIVPSEIVLIGGKPFVRGKKQHYRVCACRVVYMNCMKCNSKLARRKSDYVSLMVKHARESSVRRHNRRPGEDHSFSPAAFVRLVRERVRVSGMVCECFLCQKLPFSSRQRLSVRGPNKLSVDRAFDNLGYTHADQRLRLISKSHHSPQQRDAVPLPVSSATRRRRRWVEAAVSGMLKRSKARFRRTKAEICGMVRAGMCVEEMVGFLKTHVLDRKACVSMILQKKRETAQCPRCGEVLEYGDDAGGFLNTKNNPRRASPDRLNDRVGYVAENVRIVCCACQTLGSVDDTEDVFLDGAEVADLVDFLDRKVLNLS